MFFMQTQFYLSDLEWQGKLMVPPKPDIPPPLPPVNTPPIQIQPKNGLLPKLRVKQIDSIPRSGQVNPSSIQGRVFNPLLLSLFLVKTLMRTILLQYLQKIRYLC